MVKEKVVSADGVEAYLQAQTPGDVSAATPLSHFDRGRAPTSAVSSILMSAARS